ncbi:hypothetical protein QQF64_018798, partial [Cirrhinus molitorella]
MRIFNPKQAGNRYQNYLLSDSSRDAGGNYTVSSAALNHTGVYVCTAEKGKPAYYTAISNTQLIWVTGVSAPVSLIISPSRTQHFTSVSLSLSCEDKSNSTGWRVRRHTDRWGLEDCSSSVSQSQTGSTCTINFTITYDTGVYWCESESQEKSHPVNVTVHFGVILESPVHPVTEGDTLTLRCLYQLLTPPNLRADFYKDGSLIQSQTTEMIITTVSKSHEGFYYCKHTERGDSPKSWISVTVSHPESQMSVLHVFSSVLAVCPYLLVTVVLIFKCCKMRDETMDFRHDTQKKTVKRLIQEGESDLPEHIDVSVRKKQPMDLSDLCREEDSSVESRLWQNESPEPSCVSMKSDWSMEHPIHFSLGESSADL